MIHCGSLGASVSPVASASRWCPSSRMQQKILKFRYVGFIIAMVNHALNIPCRKLLG